MRKKIASMYTGKKHAKLSQASNSQARMMWQEVTSTVDNDSFPRLTAMTTPRSCDNNQKRYKHSPICKNNFAPIDITSRTELEHDALSAGIVPSSANLNWIYYTLCADVVPGMQKYDIYAYCILFAKALLWTYWQYHLPMTSRCTFFL